MNSYTSTHSFEQQLLREKNIKQMLANNANADLERKLVYQATAGFRQSVTPEHSLYAVTIVPYLEHLIRYRLTRSRSDCSAYIQNLVSEFVHLFHKTCNNSYSRYKPKLTRFFAPVEFQNKYHNESVTPHTHSCFAVHPEYLEIFESLLIQHPMPNSERPVEDQMTIDFLKLKNRQNAIFLKARINSIHITRLKRSDFMTYASYCFKDEIHSLKLKERR
jgi:hypothetical protein